MVLLQSNFSLFLGHFHPVVVHLPIGFLLLAGILEYFSRKPNYNNLTNAISISLLLGAISATLAALFGWFLANKGGYANWTLFWHRWLGIGVAVLSLAAWAIKTERLKASPSIYNANVIGIVALLFITGHLGGNLTHGSDYLLQYAPGFVQKVFGAKGASQQVQDFSKINPDSVQIYAQLIQPLLEKKCYACHNDSKSNGGLNMSTEELLLEGGDHGAVLVAGNARESELVKRITMNQSSRKFMPPSGLPLNYYEIRILEWWIDSGLSFEESITAQEVPKEIKEMLLEHYKLSTVKKPYVEIAEVEPAPEQAIQKLRANGFKVNQLASSNYLLEVSGTDTVTAEQLKSVLEVKEQLTWLNLGNCGITDDMLSTISELPNLTRLRLEKNPVSGEGVKQLSQLPHLESLNLYATQVDDAALESIKSISTLQSIYLWQSKVSQEAAEQLRQDRPKLDVNTGLSFNSATAEKEESLEESGDD